MKKENIVVIGLTVTVILSYFIYVGLNKNSDQQASPENIFLQAEPKYKSLAKDYNEEEILKYAASIFKFSDLPLDLQKKIRNRQMAAHAEIMTLLKEYIVRYHIAAKKADEEGKPPIPKNNVPSINPIDAMGENYAKIEEVYQQNKDKFPKDHDPFEVKVNLGIELFSDKMYEFVMTYLSDAYYKKGLWLPAYPKVDQDWFKTKVTQTYGNENATNHLVWIGNYADEKNENTTNDIGLLVKKYSLKDLKISFIPYTNTAFEYKQYLNMVSLCVRQEGGESNFWKYHSLANAQRKDLKVKPKTEMANAKEFAKKVLDQVFTEKNLIQQTFQCADADPKSNPVLQDLLLAQRKFNFLPNNKTPVFFFNGRMLDLEGRRLFSAVDQLLSQKTLSQLQP